MTIDRVSRSMWPREKQLLLIDAPFQGGQINVTEDGPCNSLIGCLKTTVVAQCTKVASMLIGATAMLVADERKTQVGA